MKTNLTPYVLRLPYGSNRVGFLYDMITCKGAEKICSLYSLSRVNDIVQLGSKSRSATPFKQILRLFKEENFVFFLQLWKETDVEVFFIFL